jgi:hypothetical protein
MFTKKSLFNLAKKNFCLRGSPLREVFIKESNPQEEIIVSKDPYSESILSVFRSKPSNLVIVSGKPLNNKRFRLYPYQKN